MANHTTSPEQWFRVPDPDTDKDSATTGPWLKWSQIEAGAEVEGRLGGAHLRDRARSSALGRDPRVSPHLA
jgi:hypothetical protein